MRKNIFHSAAFSATLYLRAYLALNDNTNTEPNETKTTRSNNNEAPAGRQPCRGFKLSP
jgi:hypothetical protein